MLPQPLRPAEVATPFISENMRAFFGNQSPLSSFFEKEFNIDGRVYPHMEKYFQEQQCKAGNDNRLAKAVLEASTAAECKRLVRGLNLDQGEWRRKGEGYAQCCIWQILTK